MNSAELQTMYAFLLNKLGAAYTKLIRVIYKYEMHRQYSIKKHISFCV